MPSDGRSGIGGSEGRAPELAEEARRQGALVASSPHAEDDQAFADSLANSLDGEPVFTRKSIK
ncbi:MAG TPA: hypothetical protein DEQ43_04990 [Nocardioides bacterium]|uniref:antitoxin MazE-like protein n=1 Tax=uncultured Nocardioides sp. TaxID=198441 RepID=UPI000ECEEC3B|nr:hypothetical protein [Nocardioides sp.]